MKSSIDMTLGELLLGCLYYYGMLWLFACAVVIPVYFALSNAYETIFAVREGDPDDDA